jgi:hypothetical protein
MRSRRETFLFAASSAIFITHIVIVVAVLWPSLVDGYPPMWGDNAPSFYKAVKSLQILKETQDSAGYDPQIFAGYPTGIVDTNSHGVHVLMRLLTRWMVPERAFATWLLLGLTVAPLLLAFSAFAASRGARASAFVLIATCICLHLDPLCRHFVRFGTVPWIAAVSVALTFAVLFARTLEQPSWRRIAATSALTSLFCLHMLLPPLVGCIFLVVAALRALGDRSGLRRAALAASIVAVSGVLINLWWVVPLILHWSMHGNVDEALAVPPQQLLGDLRSIVAPGTGYLYGSYGIRWFVVAMGLGGAVSVARVTKSLTAKSVLWIVILSLGLSYFAGLTAWGRGIQHYRAVVVMIFGALIFFPTGVCMAARWTGVKPVRRVAFAGVLGLVLVGGLSELRHAVELPLRLQGIKPGDDDVVRFLADQASTQEGRLLVETDPDDSLAVAIATMVNRPAVSFPSPGMAWPFGVATWTNLPPMFLGVPLSQLDPKRIHHLLDLYGVAWVVAREGFGTEQMQAVPSDYFDRDELIGRYRVYRVRAPKSMFLEGYGQVELRPGRLLLTDLRGPVVVRFHFAEGLKAQEAGVSVDRYPLRFDPAGFIRIDPGFHQQVELEWHRKTLF